jgi:hypothetical protein
MSKTGQGGKRRTEDVLLSRYAAYLVVMNGDPKMPIVAMGQEYFAEQTRQIHARKGLQEGEHISDWMGSDELIANSCPKICQYPRRAFSRSSAKSDSASSRVLNCLCSLQRKTCKEAIEQVDFRCSDYLT